jgi:hypothetical protein
MDEGVALERTGDRTAHLILLRPVGEVPAIR